MKAQRVAQTYLRSKTAHTVTAHTVDLYYKDAGPGSVILYLSIHLPVLHVLEAARSLEDYDPSKGGTVSLKNWRSLAFELSLLVESASAAKEDLNATMLVFERVLREVEKIGAKNWAVYPKTEGGSLYMRAEAPVTVAIEGTNYISPRRPPTLEQLLAKLGRIPNLEVGQPINSSPW